LTDKGGEIVVFEVTRKNFFGKLIDILYNERITFLIPGDDVVLFRVLEKKRLVYGKKEKEKSTSRIS